MSAAILSGSKRSRISPCRRVSDCGVLSCASEVVPLAGIALQVKKLRLVAVDVIVFEPAFADHDAGRTYRFVGLGEDVAFRLLALDDRQQAGAIVGQARLGTG